MTGPTPTRLMHEAGGDELAASLLQLAKHEGPSPEGRRKILAGIAAGGAASFATQGAKAASVPTGQAVAVKWGFLGAGAVVLAVPAALLLGGSPTPGAHKLAAASMAPVSVAQPRMLAPATDDPAPLAVNDLPALEEASSSGAAPAAPLKQGSLADEVAQLQKAKLALKGGNPARALAELGSYAQRFPRPMLGAEATVVRIEALSASGDTTRAKSLAAGFLAKNPNSPYGKRLRSLTGAR